MSEHYYKQQRGLSKYYHLMRPHTLTASFVPVVVGTACAMLFTEINWLLFFAMLIASLLIQAATNMFNEYFDYKKGLDDHESIGIGGAIVRNGMSPNAVFNLAVTFYVIAALIGLYITIQSSWWILLIGTICMAVGYLYTGGPFPISWTPFGEIFAGFFMGYVIIMITFFIQTGHIHYVPMLFSIPISFNIGLLNMANNIRDREKDKKSGRKTFTILFGKSFSIIVMTLLYIFDFVLILWIIFFKPIGSLWMLIVFISIPLVIKAVKQFNRGSTPPELMPAMATVGKFNTIFGFLLGIAIILTAITGI